MTFWVSIASHSQPRTRAQFPARWAYSAHRRRGAAVVLYGPKPALNARYFPQPLTSFTLDALGVFYLSLSLSVLFMIGQRGMATLVTYLRGAIGLVSIIVIATLLNIGIFHFTAHPRHIVYLATYLVVMIGTVGILWWNHRETSRAARPAGLPAPAVGGLRLRGLQVVSAARVRAGARSRRPNRTRTGRAGRMRRIAAAAPGRSCARE